MSFKLVTDERTGRKIKVVSDRAVGDMIAQLQRQQKRLLAGTTLKTAVPVCEFGAKSFGMQVTARPQIHTRLFHGRKVAL